MRDVNAVDIDIPAILVRINRRFRSGITNEELYDATRGHWKVGRRRNGAQYAFAVYRGIVCEVYEIEGWLPAGSTLPLDDPQAAHNRGRWEFIGRVADKEVRQKYLGRSVAHYFTPGSRNPVQYEKC